MTATLLEPSRTASVTLEIPEPTPTGRSNTETTYYVHRYGYGITDSDETESLEQAIRDLFCLGSDSSELRAQEFQRDIEGEPTDLRTCRWMETLQEWSDWK